MSPELKNKLKSRLENLLNDEQILPFFTQDWEVKTEQMILQDSGETYIPDRLLIKDKKVKIIDYKTGSTSQVEKHKLQVEKYYKALKNMGFKDVSKYIIYTEEYDKIVQW
jgi:ATP-dependent exoDNAse (exonuclease V) beta subunit